MTIAARTSLVQYQSYAEPIMGSAVAGVVGRVSAIMAVAAATVQYQAVAAPVRLPPAALPPITWAPEYVDKVDAAPQASIGWATADLRVAATRSSTTYQWPPEFPDFALGAPVPQPVGGRSDVQAMQVSPLAWAPVFSDGVRSQIVLTVSSRSETPSAASLVPILAFAPEFPDTLGLFASTPSSPMRTEPLSPAFPVPLSSWDGVYPDIARAATPLPDWQTTALAPMPLAVTPLAWASEYPDRAPSALGTTVPAWAFLDWEVVRPTTPVLSWRSTWADQILTPPTPLVTGGAVTPSPATLPIFVFSGQQGAVHFAVRAVQYQAMAGIVAVPVIVVPTFWQPDYPDLAPGAPSVVRVQPQHTFGALVDVPQFDSWMGWQPPSARGPERVADFPAHAFIDFEAVRPVSPILAWAAKYSDRAPGALPLPDWQTIALYPVPILLPTQQLGWRGSYPDWPPQSRPTEYPAFTTGSTASSLPIPTVSWRSLYADRAPGAAPLPDWQTLGFHPRPLTSVPALAWQPEYVDFAVGAESVIVAARVAWVSGSIPSEFTVPARSWAGVYADR